MRFITFLRSGPGRITRIAVGLLLLALGARSNSMAGVVLLVVGLIPVVTAIANICLLDDVHAMLADIAHQSPRPMRHK